MPAPEAPNTESEGASSGIGNEAEVLFKIIIIIIESVDSISKDERVFH